MVSEFTKISNPLLYLTAKNAKSIWGDPQIAGVNTPKFLLTTASILRLAEMLKIFGRKPDVSAYSLEACLFQVEIPSERLEETASRMLSAADMYAVTNYLSTYLTLRTNSILW